MTRAVAWTRPLSHLVEIDLLRLSTVGTLLVPEMGYEEVDVDGVPDEVPTSRTNLHKPITKLCDSGILRRSLVANDSWVVGP